MERRGSKHKRQRFEVLPGEGKRFSFRNLGQALLFYTLLLLVLLVIVQIGYHWIGEQFLAWRLQIVNAEQGVMLQEIAVEGLITRHEDVIEAPADGVILWLADPGERIPADTKLVILKLDILTDSAVETGDRNTTESDNLWELFKTYWQQLISGGTDDWHSIEKETVLDNEPGPSNQHEETNINDTAVIYSETPGFLSYFIDGWESFGGPLYLPKESFMIDQLFTMELVEGDTVRKGQPICKIVDNWEWYFSITLPLYPGRSISELPVLTVRFDFAPEDDVRMELFDIQVDETANNIKLAYTINRQLPGFDQARWVEATLLYGKKQGIIIPVQAVFEKESSPGVYINQGGRVVFRPVTVIEQQDNQVMVDGLLPQSLVITRPDLVEEGQRLN